MIDKAYIPWVILGAGRVGTAVALLGAQLGVELRAVWSRSGVPSVVPKTHRVEGDLDGVFQYLGGAIVWITVVDEAIEAVARAIAPHLRPADIVVHCSGLLNSRVLRHAGITNPVASIHPLLSVADPKVAVEQFATCAWTIEGDFPALAFAKWALTCIGVDPFEIEPDQKVLYHASAVTAAGLFDALMDVALTLSEASGFSSDQGRALLIPLARSILTNLETRDTAAALTGPVARGDESVVEQHIAAIEALGDDSALEVYRALTHRARGLKDNPH